MSRMELHLQDCIVGMRDLEAASVDVIVTSPPYNLGVRYSRFRDDADRCSYLEWAGVWARELRRVLRERGSFFLNVGASPTSPLLPHQLALLMSELFCLQNTIHWVKSIAVPLPSGEVVTAGHFKPINSYRYLTDCHEYLFHFTPQGNTPVERLAVGVPYTDKSNIRRWQHSGGRDLRCRGNTWCIPYSTIRRRESERPHPATFPVELAAHCLRLHGVTTASTVLDPFLGLGTSALAAQRCGAGRFIGYEIDEGYLEEARKRVEREEAAV